VRSVACAWLGLTTRPVKPKDIFDDDAEIEIVMPLPTESESSTESAAGCSTTSHTCTYAQHDGSHPHAKSSRSHHGHGLGPSRSLCCGNGSRPGRARAVTAFIHVSPLCSSDLGSRSFRSSLSLSLSFWMLNRRDGTSLSRFRMPFLRSAVGGMGCKLCGVRNIVFHSTCAIETDRPIENKSRSPIRPLDGL